MTAPLSPGESLSEVVMVPTALQLFRYSAVTWNAHRIHYDRDWATHEGHGGLVVHSHLHAANALRALTQGLGCEWHIRKVSYRIVRSAVAGDTLTARAELAERSADGRTLTFTLREYDQNGDNCLEGSATVEARA